MRSRMSSAIFCSRRLCRAALGRCRRCERFCLAEQATQRTLKLTKELLNWLRLRRELLFDSDRKSTRLNSSHANISYAVSCLKKKKNNTHRVESDYSYEPATSSACDRRT